jgi:hypothetical protein
MRCHTGPEKQRGIVTLRAYHQLRQRTRTGKHLAATCCTNATETPSALTGLQLAVLAIGMGMIELFALLF